MATVEYSDSLKEEYTTLFNTIKIKEDWMPKVSDAVKKIKNSQLLYEESVTGTTIPWYFIAIIHYLESGANFYKQILNGQSYAVRTTIVPKGLGPWSSWEDSTRFAIKRQNWVFIEKWDIPQILYLLELHNGFGYRMYRGINSPYLWSGSNHYVKGKYVADGRYDKNAVSSQIGAALLLHKIMENGEKILINKSLPIIRYSNSKIPYATNLQSFLNTFPGIKLKVDGWPGTKTSEAFQAITGYYLHGDPRNAN